MEECQCIHNKGLLKAGEEALLEEVCLRSRNSRCSIDDERGEGYKDNWGSRDESGNRRDWTAVAYYVGLGVPIKGNRRFLEVATRVLEFVG